MQEIYIEPIRKVILNKKRLEQELGVKIINKGKQVFVEGDPEKEFLAMEVLKAINLGFSTEKALLLKNEGLILHCINIKDVTKRQDLERIRGRIIGRRGKAISTLTGLTSCSLSVHDNQIGIIGDCEQIEDAAQAVTSLIHGSKHSNVYARVEKHRKQKRIEGKIPIKNELS